MLLRWRELLKDENDNILRKSPNFKWIVVIISIAIVLLLEGFIRKQVNAYGDSTLTHQEIKVMYLGGLDALLKQP